MSGPEILPLEIVNWPLLIVRLPMIRLALPSLVTVTFFVALEEPTCTVPKSMEGGITLMSGLGG